MESIFKISKRSIAAILTLCLLLGIAGTCVYAASVMPEENPTATDGIIVATEESTVADEETTSELMPMMAQRCYDDVIYQSSSINEKGNIPNATYYWTSGGSPNGTIYSIAHMDKYGRTTYRDDLVSYNGGILHHGNVTGPHRHIYEWGIHTDSSGSIFHYIKNVIVNALS